MAGNVDGWLEWLNGVRFGFDESASASLELQPPLGCIACCKFDRKRAFRDPRLLHSYHHATTLGIQRHNATAIFAVTFGIISPFSRRPFHVFRCSFLPLALLHDDTLSLALHESIHLQQPLLLLLLAVLRLHPPS